MELKPGYRQTEVGVIPEDWEVKKIRDVCTLINGRGFKPHEWGTFGLPIIRIQNLNGSGDFNYYSGSYNPKILVENGQLLFAWSGSRGTSFGPHLWNGGRALLNYHTWKVVVDESQAATHFFFHALRNLTSYIEDRAHGASALVHTQKGEMEQFSLLIPPIPVQRAVATTLSDVDTLISALDQLIAKKRDLKQAAMQQLLPGKQRLPGFHGEWLVRRLGDVFDVAAGGDFDASRSSLIQDERYPYPIYSNSVSALGFYGYCTYSDHQSNSITVTARGTLGVANFRDHKYTAIGRVLVLQPKEKVDGRFFAEFINNRINFVVESTGVPQLTAPQISNYKLRVPPFPEQTAIATILSDMDAERGALEARREKTHALKQGMMQELLTGKTRLV